MAMDQQSGVRLIEGERCFHIIARRKAQLLPRIMWRGCRIIQIDKLEDQQLGWIRLMKLDDLAAHGVGIVAPNDAVELTLATFCP